MMIRIDVVFYKLRQDGGLMSGLVADFIGGQVCENTLMKTHKNS